MSKTPEIVSPKHTWDSDCPSTGIRHGREINLIRIKVRKRDQLERMKQSCVVKGKR